VRTPALIPVERPQFLGACRTGPDITGLSRAKHRDHPKKEWSHRGHCKAGVTELYGY